MKTTFARSLAASIAFVSLFASLVFAEGMDHQHHHAAPSEHEAQTKHEDINVAPHEAIIMVHGIVCSFCAQGVQRKLSKLPFIDTSKYSDGVKVEIEQQRVTIALKPTETLDVQQVFSAIKSGGYEPIKAFVSDNKGGWTTHQPTEV